MTNGASFGAAGALLQATLPHNGYTRQAFIVSPTYFLINSVFLDAGFAGKLTAVPETPGQGIDFAYLEAQLQKHDAAAAEHGPVDVNPEAVIGDSSRPPRKIYRYVIYLVPTYSNPSGSTMSVENRQRLIELARKHDMLILCDDIYDMLSYPGSDPIPPRIVTLDRATLPSPASEGNTISNLSFSKILGPGLRVGWQETVSPSLAQSLAMGGAIRSGGTPGHLNSMIVGELLDLGMIDGIISNLSQTYKKRAACFLKAAKTHLPEGTQIFGGQGGYFFWVETPRVLDAKIVAAKCKERGVGLANGSHFEVDGDEQDWGKTGQRVSVSYLSEEDIVKGVEIWGQVCAEMMAEASSSK